MPIFYRGAGVGTWWHTTKDATATGFTPQDPGMPPSIDLLIQHIVNGTTTSPYISLTRSYGVAYNYARYSGRAWPTPAQPAYVYTLRLNDPLPAGLQLIDPVQEIAAAVRNPLHSSSYQHDGEQSFLLGVVAPWNHKLKQYLTKPYKQPPPGGGTSRPPHLSRELEAFVRALRDAEVLAVGNIPKTCVLNRYAVP